MPFREIFFWLDMDPLHSIFIREPNKIWSLWQLLGNYVSHATFLCFKLAEKATKPYRFQCPASPVRRAVLCRVVYQGAKNQYLGRRYHHLRPRYYTFFFKCWTQHQESRMVSSLWWPLPDAILKLSVCMYIYICIYIMQGNLTLEKHVDTLQRKSSRA